MRQSERGSLLIGAGVTIAILSASLAGMGWLYKGALEDKARIEAEYEVFKAETKRLGEEAEAKNAETLKQRERIANESIKSLGKRAADAIARADKLCKSAGLSAGCRELPAVPDTARPVDDKARDQRLLAILVHAQNAVDQLVELQTWVWMNQKRE